MGEAAQPAAPTCGVRCAVNDVVQNASALTLSVVMVTWRRPDYLAATLRHVARLVLPVDEVLVVIAPGDPASAVVDAHPWVTKVAFPGAAGSMTRARNEGLLHASGSVIAFLDDDAYPRERWSRNLLAVFEDPTVFAVAGRTCNGAPDDAGPGIDAVGRLLANGRLTGNFAADTGVEIDVDHGIGANMAFRREVLGVLGGLRDDFPGPALLEDTDLFTRVRALGYRVVFAPQVVVDHVGAPHVSGRRFDWRYMFWARHNHVLFLARNFGLGSSRLRRWIAEEIRTAYVRGEPVAVGAPRALARAALTVLAVAAGVATSARKAQWHASTPIRSDAIGVAIRRHLGGPQGSAPPSGADNAVSDR